MRESSLNVSSPHELKVIESLNGGHVTPGGAIESSEALLVSDADEVVGVGFRKADPALVSGPNGSGSRRGAVLLAGAVTCGPLLVAHDLTAHPEPEADHAGVTETQPHVRSGGARRHLLQPALDLLRDHRHQVHVSAPAAFQSVGPRPVLSDQNQLIWSTNRLSSSDEMNSENQPR